LKELEDEVNNRRAVVIHMLGVEESQLKTPSALW